LNVILSTSASGGGWTQTLVLGIMRQVLYHCANSMEKIFVFEKVFYLFNGVNCQKCDKHICAHSNFAKFFEAIL
jgi:hypothetical protein